MDHYQGLLYGRLMIAKRVRAARQKLGLTLREVGDELDVTPQAVARWEKVNVQVAEPRLKEIADVLAVDPKWLSGKIGTDEIITSCNVGDYSTSAIPLLDLADAIPFALLGEYVQRGNQEKPWPAVKPSAHIKGKGFAIKIDKTDSVGPLRAGDIAIFDNGISPRKDDVVLAVSIQDNMLRGFLADYVLRSDGNADDMLYTRPQNGLDMPSGSSDGKPIAVLVEYRKIRSE